MVHISELLCNGSQLALIPHSVPDGGFSTLKKRWRRLKYTNRMSPEYTSQMTVGLLLMSLFSVVSIGMLLTFVFIRYVDRKRVPSAKSASDPSALNDALPLSLSLPPFENPSRWLAIRGSNPLAAQSALRLHNAKPCSWCE